MGKELFWGTVKVKAVKQCEVCKNNIFDFLFKQKDKGLRGKKLFSVNQCKKCGSIFLNPSLTKDELKKYYPHDEYYSLKNIDKGIKTKLRLALYQTYFSNNKNIIKKIILSPFSFLARGTIIKNGLKLLDIGCGSGQFLYEMKNLGLNVWGVEPGNFNKNSAEKEGLRIQNTGIGETKFPSNLFDMITLNHVLEHLGNPRETLKEIYRILKNGGTFIVAVPDTNSLAYKIFGKNWYQLDVPRHLINYSDSNLTRLLLGCGFKINKIRYNSRPSQFVISLSYLLGFKNRRVERVLDIFFLPLTWIVNLLRVGDQVEIWCEK